MSNAIRIGAVMLVLSCSCFGGFNGDIWPACSNSPREAITANYFAKDAWQGESTTGINERCSVAGIAGLTLSWWRCERANLAQAKTKLNALLGYYVDYRQTSSWPTVTYYTKSNMIVYADLPTNFFEYTPWRMLNQSSNGWDGIYRIITNLSHTYMVGSWNRKGENNYYYGGSPSFAFTLAAARSSADANDTRTSIDSPPLDNPGHQAYYYDVDDDGTCETSEYAAFFDVIFSYARFIIPSLATSATLEVWMYPEGLTGISGTSPDCGTNVTEQTGFFSPSSYDMWSKKTSFSASVGTNYSTRIGSTSHMGWPNDACYCFDCNNPTNDNDGVQFIYETGYRITKNPVGLLKWNFAYQ